MSKNLLIVESPSKARTIKKYLGKEFAVLASVGHIKDLPVKELGIDLYHDFKPRYVTIKGKTKIIQQLRTTAQEVTRVYLAPDPDREGEAIAWHIANVLDVPDEKILRVLFNEITYGGIQYGINHPRKIDQSLVNAQQARRIMDRLVGYQVSPFLWKTLYSGLSAGRVQSVALRIICEREEKIENFVSREYWEIEVDLATPRSEYFTARCIAIKGKAPDIPDEKTVCGHLEILKTANYVIDSVNVKSVSKLPQPPFTTSTLQQEATRRFRFPPSKTMKIAQQLYEGVDIAGDRIGLITYMRTDSVRIANEAIGAVRELIGRQYGADYLPEHARYFKTKKKNVQDAHEGIRPTRFDLDPDKIAGSLTPDQKKLYQLIWNRFVACQMAAARYRQTTVDVRASNYLFRAVGNELLFDGYLRALREEPKAEAERKIPEGLVKGEELNLQEIRPLQKFTEPPTRFNEGTLIKELDSLGIGRPSTYATIVTTILDRNYVERKSGSLMPTELGRTVNKLLIHGMPNIFNVKFTAEMEEQLDDIESNKKPWLDVIREFYKPFKKALDDFNYQSKRIKEQLQQKTEEICDLCGAPMLIKWSKRGKFLACSAFPKCRNTRPLDSPRQPDSNVTKNCPKCGSPMLVKEGKFGKFWACSAYPKCKTTEPFTLNIHCPEPDCPGEIVARRTRQGKVFYGCNRYPDCKFATWNEPIAQDCPTCGYPLLERKNDRRKGTIIICPKCKTEYNAQHEQ
jgi:DNA topoisomerase-1